MGRGKRWRPLGMIAIAFGPILCTIICTSTIFLFLPVDTLSVLVDLAGWIPPAFLFTRKVAEALPFTSCKCFTIILNITPCRCFHPKAIWIGHWRASRIGERQDR